jgi:hypothetical protein
MIMPRIARIAREAVPRLIRSLYRKMQRLIRHKQIEWHDPQAIPEKVN